MDTAFAWWSHTWLVILSDRLFGSFLFSIGILLSLRHTLKSQKQKYLLKEGYVERRKSMHVTKNRPNCQSVHLAEYDYCQLGYNDHSAPGIGSSITPTK